MAPSSGPISVGVSALFYLRKETESLERHHFLEHLTIEEYQISIIPKYQICYKPTELFNDISYVFL
jgi:hypothetical protein